MLILETGDIADADGVLLKDELKLLTSASSVTVKVSTEAVQGSELGKAVTVTVSGLVSVMVDVAGRSICFAALNIEHPIVSSDR